MTKTAPMVRQAIITKYLWATDQRGSRIKATAYAKSKTVPYDHALNIEANHAAAARALAEDLKWRGAWHQGGHPDGSGYVFVSTDGGALDSSSMAFAVSGE